MIEMVIIVAVFALFPLAYIAFMFTPLVVLFGVLRNDGRQSHDDSNREAQGFARVRFERMRSVLIVTLGLIVFMVTSSFYGTTVFRYGMLLVQSVNVVAYVILVLTYLIPTSHNNLLNRVEYKDHNRFMYYWLHFAPATHFLVAFWFSYELILQLIQITVETAVPDGLL
jgi:hypothetical protein